MTASTFSLIGKTIDVQFGRKTSSFKGCVGSAIVLQRRDTCFGERLLVERVDPVTKESTGQLGSAELEDGRFVCYAFHVVGSDEYGGPWTRERCVESLLFDPVE